MVLRPERGIGYFGSWLEFPMVMGDGPNIEACVRCTTEALVSVLAYLIESNKEIPAPSSDEKRGTQVNIRLTALEKLRLETLAQQQGFRSISDYIRTAALSRPA